MEVSGQLRNTATVNRTEVLCITNWITGKQKKIPQPGIELQIPSHLILSPGIIIIELRPLVMHCMIKQTLPSLFTFAFNYLCRYVFQGSSAQLQYLLSTSGHIHPTPPFTTLHNALICLQERASYRNIASRNINICVPRPQGETGLILRSEKSLLLVMKNAHRSSGTGVL